jgi:purine-binding chemotaxis protein CheW
VPVISLAERLGVPQPSDDAEAFNVLIRTPDGPVSLLVDRVGDVVEVSPQSFEPAPDTLRPALRTLIRGAYKLERRLLLALDAASAIRVEE